MSCYIREGFCLVVYRLDSSRFCCLLSHVAFMLILYILVEILEGKSDKDSGCFVRVRFHHGFDFVGFFSLLSSLYCSNMARTW